MSLSLFPGDMMKSASSEMTLETIAAKFSYFFEQIHLIHLQTPSHAEHSALNIWEDVVDAKDAILEELMGYEGRKVKAYKMEIISDYSPGMPTRIVTDLKNFARQLEQWADGRGYSNIENMAQDLSGKAARVLYLLTQS